MTSRGASPSSSGMSSRRSSHRSRATRCAYRARARTSCSESSSGCGSSTSRCRSSSRTIAEVPGAERAMTDRTETPDRLTLHETVEAVDAVDPAMLDEARAAAVPAEAEELEPVHEHEIDAADDVQPESPPSGPRTVGRFIADALRSAGVRYAFTVPGESFLGLLDALGDAGIRVVPTRHEGGAAFMAEAHGQLTGRPAAALGTRAVGASNLAIGIHTAKQDSTPMFAIVGQVERADRGREAFQEIDQVATIGGLAKWAAEPRTAAEVAGTMSEALRQALDGRPGPVLLSFPEDLLDETMPEDTLVETRRVPAPRPADDDL